ncbi:similar to Saccharomyces cerevisiae YLR045C STU2 Microtubule-associated protein (MAP) of the XMAP215/Dis1 family [Maudiozyma saulgeensis]|uniref:Similar to Saccharomyces cerevisiae YLR045C STU2 Microtubule-associated protein (MAP) of the XMAP215/Dis1 family n=1 Tax=Maudiozyma saulgeensis TaxID=1789683 RepID=A0A1X7R4Z8_9SACH|nr:similar to Saccharomyces cerevisiae YLR045C STU2 Microtubule-associated protein (MAP) of the XMAP215/Dis1 family [Kazachstania saulgeensis]
MSTSNIGTSSAADDIDFNKLSLDEKLNNRNWKGRLLGYQELIKVFNNAVDVNDSQIRKYWNDPSHFESYLLDSNVVSHEQAVIALEALITFMKPLTSDLGNKSHKLLNAWIPSLIEKGLGSSRQHTREISTSCILSLCSLDNSIETTIDISIPFLEKKLPRLLSATLNIISKLLSIYGIINIKNLLTFFNHVLEHIPKLASHADKSVRAESLNVILQIYIIIHDDTDYNKFLQDFITDNLKNIQQRELTKMFENIQTDNIIQFTPFETTRRANELANIDGDGDTIMLDGDNKSSIDNNNGIDLSTSFNGQEQNRIDPFTLLPVETILDKLPEQFYERAQSSKWKDRVEALEEFYNDTLTKIKKIDPKANYTSLLDVYATILSKDVNLQAVTLSTESIDQIFNKLGKKDLNKNYCILVFSPLLSRTKEKKATAIEPIRNCLKMICNNYNPLLSENEEFLIEILFAMKHKIPQIRLECTILFTDLLQNMKQLDKKSILKRLNQENDPDSILPIVIKIVNDTQPTLRNAGFECLATLIKLFGERYFNDSLEHLDNMKRNKINDLVTSLPTFNKSTNDQQQVIPSKRGPPQRVTSLQNISPKRSNNLIRNDEHSLKNIKLTKTNNISPKNEPKAILERQQNNINEMNNVQSTPNTAVNTLKKENTVLNKERTDLITQLSQLKKDNEMLLSENKNLKDEKIFLKKTIVDKESNLEEKLNEVKKLNEKINTLEQQIISLKESQSLPPVSNGGTLSQKGSSDDLRRGVGSLRLNSSIESTATSNLNLNFGIDKDHNNLKIINSDNEESWKRAAEVTKMLKERIEKMRARTK